ncbi:hypothetical protein GCM10009727_33410 [Actinomadura napierensis]|uniref:Uncharacterized protein n=1 Tax=Actinomadura napierensis TaxID=267854 RepID=A0ABN2Z792_9ACTN
MIKFRVMDISEVECVFGKEGRTFDSEIEIVRVIGARVFVWWGGAGVRGRPSKVKGAFGVASRWTSSTLDFGASAAPEAALKGQAPPAPPGRATPPPTHVRVLTNPHKTTIDTFLQSLEIKGPSGRHLSAT